MRYALRNQHKIKAHFEPKGQEILDRIIMSLDIHFNKIDPFTEHVSPEQLPEEKYKTLIINDAGHTCACISFYILEIKFDVCRLAFIEFIG